MTTSLPQSDYAALVAAIDVSCGVCTCGLLFRRLRVRCHTCCERDWTLASLLASQSIEGRIAPGGKATVELWSAWRSAPATFRLLEPIR